MAWDDPGNFEKWLLENSDYDDEVEYVQPVRVFEVDYYPGTGHDCDDCGYNGDAFHFEAFDDDRYTIFVSYGCTGGLQNTVYSGEQLKELFDLQPAIYSMFPEPVAQVFEFLKKK